MIIYVEGTFNERGRFSVGSNKSIIGTKNGANFTAAGFTIIDADNVIIRNIAVGHTPSGRDNLKIRNSTRVWIDHNEFWDDGSQYVRFASVAI